MNNFCFVLFFLLADMYCPVLYRSTKQKLIQFRSEGSFSNQSMLFIGNAGSSHVKSQQKNIQPIFKVSAASGHKWKLFWYDHWCVVISVIYKQALRSLISEEEEAHKLTLTLNNDLILSKPGELSVTGYSFIRRPPRCKMKYSCTV